MPEWVYIDSSVLRSARDAKGFSYETMARQIPVASKTWERYEKAGRVPRPLVLKVAEILDLEIEEPERRRAQATVDGDPSLDDILDAITRLDTKIDTAITERLEALEAAVRDLSRQAAASTR